MEKLLVNRKPVDGPWGGGNLFVRALCENAPLYGYEITHKIEPGIKKIVLVDPRYDELGISAKEILEYKKKNPNVKVLHRVNECDARKSTKDIDHLLKECFDLIDDKIVFISSWLKDYHSLSSDNQSVIYNGTNNKWHYQSNNKNNNQKIKILVHHWSDNIMKNKFTHKIDEFVGKNSDKYEFTYIGRAPAGLNHTKVINPLFGQELGEELRKHDVYINSSLWDPAPNSITEALAVNLPTYVYKDAGGACEMVGEDHVYSSWEDLESLLLGRIFEKNKNAIQINDWSKQIESYFEILDAL